MSAYPVLSITRPWADLILNHGKDVENRTWYTSYRGPLWIHAAQSWQGSAVDFAEGLGVTGLAWQRSDYPTGIVGVVQLVNVCSLSATGHECHCGPWAAFGQYHWRLEEPQVIVPPIDCRGALKLWWPEGDLADELAQIVMSA